MPDKKLKIAQVITRMDKGGSADIVRNLICYLQGKHEIKLIYGQTLDPGKKTKIFFDEFKKNTVLLPVLRRAINPFYDFLAFIMLWHIFKKERFDIVHCHTSKAGFLARLAAKAAGLKVTLYMPHGHVFYGYFGSQKTKAIINAEKFAAHFCEKIITLTNLEKADFIRLNIVSPDKIKVIPPGIDFTELNGIGIRERQETRRNLAINDNEIAIGLISRLEPVKGVDIFLEAATLIAKKIPNIKFIICGDGTLKNKVTQAQSMLGDKLIFLGWREDRLEIMNALDILVQPSLNEAVGLNIIEAQALKVAVIASDVGGIP